VVVLLAVAGTGLLRRAAAQQLTPSSAAVAGGTAGRTAALGGVALAAALVLVVALEMSRWPPAIDPNGGWLAARLAGARIVDETGLGRVAILGVPEFKTPDAITFPIVYAGGFVGDDIASSQFVVVPCDRLFETVVRERCGGPAEDQRVAAAETIGADAGSGAARAPQLVDRFDLSPRTSISVYRR
jgi:hypothetical protein